MKCPVDETVLQMTDRQGIEIDYCPQCRGVWLDRGELDKLIERSASVAAAPQRQPTPRAVDQPRYEERHDKRYDERYDERYDRRRDATYPKRRRKESFLGDLFDF